jgi:hypothetical protein
MLGGFRSLSITSPFDNNADASQRARRELLVLYLWAILSKPCNASVVYLRQTNEHVVIAFVMFCQVIDIWIGRQQLVALLRTHANHQ